MEKRITICLCGSTKFKKEYEETNRELTLLGYIVLSVGVFKEKMTKELKDKLDELHQDKIKMADQIYIITKDNYIGESTRKEIEFASQLKKPIYFKVFWS